MISIRFRLAVVLALARAEFGVDRSWPMQRPVEQLNLTSTQLHNYKTFVEGCNEYYSRELCEPNEQERIEFNAFQPEQMTNYTEFGYEKIRAPEAAYYELRQFWDRFHLTDLTLENWPRADMYTNHWASETTMLNVYREGGPLLPRRVRQYIINDVREILEEWSGQPLQFSSMYGIRAYHNGSILSTHVDRLPLITSCILNVAQDGVEEDWPLEVVGHDGKSTNITMKPGDMLLYESHSVLHGRPYPLRGNYYANIFIHFEPFTGTLMHEEL